MKHSDPLLSKFISDTRVPRETLEKLIIYHNALSKWQKQINLVSTPTLPEAWKRHFLDSAQLFNLLSYPSEPIFDLGSGAGFPGLVLSIMGAEHVTLLESDQRKCVFLSEVIRQTGATAKVFNGRIEAMEKKAKAITSRACASLEQLFEYTAPLLLPDGECLFLKGKSATEEIETASRRWLFHVEHYPSLASAEGVALRIKGLRRK